MATLSFEGETHGELVVKVRRWLASVDGEDVGELSPHEVIDQSADLTKEALRIVASAAPEPIAQHEIVKALTSAGYRATDATATAVKDGLDSVEEVTGGSVVQMVTEAGQAAAYQMTSAVARQLLKGLRPR